MLTVCGRGGDMVSSVAALSDLWVGRRVKSEGGASLLWKRTAKSQMQLGSGRGDRVLRGKLEEQAAS